MVYREDFHKFAYNYFPDTVFKHGIVIIDRALRDKVDFISSLKRTWMLMPIEDSSIKRNPPSFDIIIKHSKDRESLIIITIPEAKEPEESCYLCIAYDKNYNFRYFTYEISGESDAERMYFLCEWTKDRQHIKHGGFRTGDIDIFINAISEQLIVELF